MGDELRLVENWQETWGWFLASTPPWTPHLIGAIGVGLAVFGLWKVATGSLGGGGKRVGMSAMVLFAIISLAPGPVIGLLLRVAELLITLVASLVNQISS